MSWERRARARHCGQKVKRGCTFSKDVDGAPSGTACFTVRRLTRLSCFGIPLFAAAAAAAAAAVCACALQLKAQKSSIAVTMEPRCFVDSGICSVTWSQDKVRAGPMNPPLSDVLPGQGVRRPYESSS
jgi:hypothetical protein